MKIFLAGGTGVVGTRAVPALVAAGHDVTAAVRSPAKADVAKKMGANPLLVDVFDPHAVLDAVSGHEAVINLATSIPSLTKAARSGAWDMNDRLRTEASANLVDAALAVGANTYVGESICFPYHDLGDQWISEDTPVDQSGPFASAADAEAAVARFTAGGHRGVVLRFAQFYAPDSNHVATFNQALKVRINPFVGLPNSYISWVHAEDAGRSVVAALNAPPGIYNIADDTPLTRKEAGAAAARAIGKKPPLTLPHWIVKTNKDLARTSKSLRISNEKFKLATGWEPTHRSIVGSWPNSKG